MDKHSIFKSNLAIPILTLLFKKVNNDSDIGDLLKIVYLANYNVSNA